MEGTVSTASFAGVDMKLEVIVIPVSDVDRAKDFYTKLGWRLDADRSAGPILSAATADLSDELMHAAFVNIPSYASAVVTTQQVVAALSAPVRLTQSA